MDRRMSWSMGAPRITARRVETLRELGAYCHTSGSSYVGGRKEHGSAAAEGLDIVEHVVPHEQELDNLGSKHDVAHKPAAGTGGKG